MLFTGRLYYTDLERDFKNRYKLTVDGILGTISSIQGPNALGLVNTGFMELPTRKRWQSLVELNNKNVI